MFVAQINRKSTWTMRSLPMGRYSRSWMTRSSLVCRYGGISPISSSSSEPPSAISKRPSLSFCAPVKAPFLYPNSSDSIRSFGIAAQLILMKGPLALHQDQLRGDPQGSDRVGAVRVQEGGLHRRAE